MAAQQGESLHRPTSERSELSSSGSFTWATSKNLNCHCSRMSCAMVPAEKRELTGVTAILLIGPWLSLLLSGQELSAIDPWSLGRWGVAGRHDPPHRARVHQSRSGAVLRLGAPAPLSRFCCLRALSLFLHAHHHLIAQFHHTIAPHQTAAANLSTALYPRLVRRPTTSRPSYTRTLSTTTCDALCPIRRALYLHCTRHCLSRLHRQNTSLSHL